MVDTSSSRTASRAAARTDSWRVRSLAAMAGILMLYLGGLAQLTMISGNMATAAILGVLPFVAADAVKALVAGAISAPRRRTTT